MPERIPDIQIMRIGANIIDQFDADSFPTAIYFPYSGVGANDPVSGALANGIYGPVSMVYGDENLPLLSKIQQILASPNPANPADSNGNGHAGAPDLDDNTHSWEGWLQPEIWNPHQQTAKALTNVPHNFQIRAYGAAMTYVAPGGGWLTPDQASPSGTPPDGWATAPTVPNGINSPASANWTFSTGLQVYYPGVSSSEDPSTASGQIQINEQAGTINFTTDANSAAFYASPRLLTITGDAGSIAGLTAVTSPLPVPSAATLGEVPTDIAQPNFPYWATQLNLNFPAAPPTPPKYYNHFVGFSAGLISDQKSALGPPYMPYFVSSTAINTPISPTNAPGAQSGVGFPVAGAGVPGASFALGWVDSSNKFHPFSFITGAFETAYNTIYDDAGHGSDGRVGAVGPGATTGVQQNLDSWGLVDPRTSRFEMSGNFVGGATNPNTTIFPDAAYSFSPASMGGIPVSGNFSTPQATVGNGNTYPEDWLVNSATLTAGERISPTDIRSSTTPTTPAYYADPDGVVRPGDGYYSVADGAGEGMSTFISASNSSSPAVGDFAKGTYNEDVPLTTTNSSGNSRHSRRPVILNRPFRSVGELGYVFRDLPFKTLDFFTASSADAALLDVFSLVDESKVDTTSGLLSSVVAGQVNINNAPYPVIAALLSGGSIKDLDSLDNLGYEGGTNPSYDVSPITAAITAYLQPAAGITKPIPNRSALVTQLLCPPPYSGINTVNLATKSFIEAPVRALADTTNTRTWNLLIDVIAQSGQMTSNAAALTDFTVQGEKRYWLHVSIDRYTGKVVAQQLEAVYE